VGLESEGIEKSAPLSVDDLFGYAGKVLRVDFTSGVFQAEVLSKVLLRKDIGGTSNLPGHEEIRVQLMILPNMNNGGK
jgi:hypothetical protein